MVVYVKHPNKPFFIFLFNKKYSKRYSNNIFQGSDIYEDLFSPIPDVQNEAWKSLHLRIFSANIHFLIDLVFFWNNVNETYWECFQKVVTMYKINVKANIFYLMFHVHALTHMNSYIFSYILSDIHVTCNSAEHSPIHGTFSGDRIWRS